MSNKTAALLAVGVAAVLFLLPGVLSGAAGASSELSEKIKRAMDAFGLDGQQSRSVLAIVDAWGKYGDGDLVKLIYILATAWHESRLRPIPEIKAREGSEIWERYQKNYWYTGFYGRGFVQLTWEGNYRKMGSRLNLDLVGNPSLALDTEIAAQIIVVGMLEGLFTGKKLSQYFNAGKQDAYNARRVVGAIQVANQDTAALIEGHYSRIIQNLS